MRFLDIISYVVYLEPQFKFRISVNQTGFVGL